MLPLMRVTEFDYYPTKPRGMIRGGANRLVLECGCVVWRKASIPVPRRARCIGVCQYALDDEAELDCTPTD